MQDNYTIIYSCTPIVFIQYQIQPTTEMPSIKANLVRFDFNPTHSLYEVQIISQCELQSIHYLCLSDHLHSLIPNVLYDHPYIYSPVPLTLTATQTHLPNGHKVTIQMKRVPSEDNMVKVADILSRQLMMLARMLYSSELQACFNPFEESVENGKRRMPGWQIGAEGMNSGVVLRLVGVELELEEGGVLENSEILMDYHTGGFLLKHDIVRIDKEQAMVHFRSGISKPRNSLRAVRLNQLNGYHLAQSITSFFERMKTTGKVFLEAWGVKFDSRFLDFQGAYLSVGSLIFRQGVEKSLSELVSPLSKYNFTYHYLKFFREVKFQDVLKASLVLFCEQSNRREVTSFRDELQKVALRMNLELHMKIIFFTSFDHLTELLSIVNNQQVEEMMLKMSLVFIESPKDKAQKDVYNKLLQILIDSCANYHLIPLSSFTNDHDQFEGLIYHHLSLIYTKFRINPWKLKNIPFLSQPMMLASLHIKPTNDGSYSVSIVGTMNVFFTKFTAVHKIGQKSTLSMTVSQTLMECLDLFNSKHKRYPQRVFLIRTDPEAQGNLDINIARVQATNRGATLTYVTFCNNHGVRLYNQVDSNYLSRDTVKKIQVMLYTTINNQLYLQMELEAPPYRVRIDPVEKNDPNFAQRVIELISKAALGGAGHTFGTGLGILDYSKKLNEYRNLNLTKWSHNLLQGMLMYL